MSGRLGIVALVLVIAALGALVVAGKPAAAEAPARWRPLLLAHAAAVRPAPPPETGSAADQADLDEIVALQAAAGTSHDPAIAYWTSSASPTRWNEILLDMIRQSKASQVRSARAIALLNAAMYDAVIAAYDAKVTFRRTLPHDRDGRVASRSTADDVSAYAATDAAIAAAARTILTAIFPGEANRFVAAAKEVEEVRMWTGMNTRSDIAAGESIGMAVGGLAVARSRSDNANALFRGTVPTLPGSWSPGRQFAGSQPDDPMAGTWTPWLMTSGSQFRPAPPPAFGSVAWQHEVDEVVGARETLTDSQFESARFWADGSGTDTPAGHWLRIAMGLIARDAVSTPMAARTLAYLGVAEADALISAWDAKYTYWRGRPVGLIPDFASAVITPNLPSYSSAHATVAAAASTVLGQFFPKDAGSLQTTAEAAAASRLYGGTNWPADIEAGLRQGRQVGHLAVSRLSADGL